MIGLLKTILIILLIYYGLRIFYRIFAPVFIRYASKKVRQQFNEESKQYQRKTYQNKAKEGEVSIDKTPPRKSNPDKKVGEYIDFEEID